MDKEETRKRRKEERAYKREIKRIDRYLKYGFTTSPVLVVFALIIRLAFFACLVKIALFLLFQWRW